MKASLRWLRTAAGRQVIVRIVGQPRRQGTGAQEYQQESEYTHVG